MRYLLGDSTESNLDFNYLTFLREVVDCAVVLLETEATLSVNLEKRDARTNEWTALIRAVEEIGEEATAVVNPVISEQPKTPAGRCAAAIAKAIKDAVGSEITAAKTSSAAARDEVDRDDQQVRARARIVLEKMLCGHDLPEADKELEATWTAGAVKARLIQRTKFGVEASMQLDAAASSLLVADLRVERIVENAEVHVHEAGGWLKKGEKLVAQKLGRYQVVGIRLTKNQTEIQLKATDASATSLSVIVPRGGAIHIEGGNAGREYTLEDRNRPGIKQLAEKLEGALREVEQKRVGLIDLMVDGKSFNAHPHPRTLADRLVGAIAPTVQLIAKHSRSPGELVLRRLLADNRREEVFISISDLVNRIETLPVAARQTFASLQLIDDLRPASKTIPPGGGAVQASAPAKATTPPVNVQTSAPVKATTIPPATAQPSTPITPSATVPPYQAATQPAARGSISEMPPREKTKTLPPIMPQRAPDLVVMDDAKVAASIDAALDDNDTEHERAD